MTKKKLLRLLREEAAEIKQQADFRDAWNETVEALILYERLDTIKAAISWIKARPARIPAGKETK